MWRWSYLQTIPMHSIVFSRLSREVCTLQSCSCQSILRCFYRVLLCTIKKNAGYPCPCCLIPKIDTIKMGMELDMHFCCAHPRVDDHPRQHTVQCARQLVFEQGIPLASDRLARILKYSGVPTLVSPNALYISWPILRPIYLECLLSQAWAPWLQLPQIICCRSIT